MFIKGGGIVADDPAFCLALSFLVLFLLCFPLCKLPLSFLALEKGLNFGEKEEIGRLLVLDIKDADYFREGGAPSQHGGGNLFAGDPEIMGWLFGR